MHVSLSKETYTTANETYTTAKETYTRVRERERERERHTHTHTHTHIHPHTHTHTDLAELEAMHSADLAALRSRHTQVSFARKWVSFAI